MIAGATTVAVLLTSTFTTLVFELATPVALAAVVLGGIRPDVSWKARQHAADHLRGPEVRAGCRSVAPVGPW